MVNNKISNCKYKEKNKKIDIKSTKKIKGQKQKQKTKSMPNKQIKK